MNFDQWWATKVAAGYQYGPDALELVRMGFEGAHASTTSPPEADPSAKCPYCHGAGKVPRDGSYISEWPCPVCFGTEGGAKS